MLQQIPLVSCVKPAAAAADGQQDLLVFSMVTNFQLTIFSLWCVTTFPLELGWGIVHGTELGCHIN